MTYRVVDDARDVRRLASCALDRDFQIVPGSVTPLSDLIRFARADSLNERALIWHADPRYLQVDGRLWLLWNDGANKPVNNQFLAEMDASGLRPTGLARVLVREHGRSPIEKNWMLFNAAGRTWTMYSICPHEVLSVDMGGETMVSCSAATVASWHSDYENIFGELRGSAQPVWTGSDFLSIAHSSYKTPTGRRYRACFYRFSGAAPFEVTHASIEPFELPNPKGALFELPKLNKDVEEVIYPCGFLVEGEQAVISYGINDEACAVCRVPVQDILSSLQPARHDAAMRLAREVQPELGSASDEAMPEVERPQPMLPLFWWNAEGKSMDGVMGKRTFVTGNFGDIASMEIVRRIGGYLPRQPRPHERKLLSIGSILHTARDGDVVWGTGVKGSKMGFEKKVSSIEVHAVRGPLTLDFLRRSGIDISRVREVFDPGCLIPVLYRAEIEQLRAKGGLRAGVRIVPHFRDDLLMRRKHYLHADKLVSADDSPGGIIGKLLGADRVVSSSLHGLIFAEALGIPSVWLAPATGEDELKYYDYYYGTGRFAVRRCATLEEALLAEPMPLPGFRHDDYVATFPKDAVDGLLSVGMKDGEMYELGRMEEPDLAIMMRQGNFNRSDSSGLWLTGRSGRMLTEVRGTQAGDRVALSISLHPYNPREIPVPQRLSVDVNGTRVADVRWVAGSRFPVEVTALIPALDRVTPIQIDMAARSARSPHSLQLSPIRTPLAVCISRLKASVLRADPTVGPG